MLEKIVYILSTHTNVKKENMNMSSKLVADLGLNSYDIVNIVCNFEEEFDLEIPDKDIRKLQTIGDIIDYLSK